MRIAPECARCGETQVLSTVRIGGIEVVSLLDGAEDLDDPDILDPVHGPSDPVWEPSRRRYPGVFAAHGGWRLHVRATLLRAHGLTVLVDTGVGGPTAPTMSWYPASGRLMGALAESESSPAEVEVVVVTHAHDDHIGGTVTAEGAPAFPNARYVINRVELDWLENLARTSDEDRAIWDRLLAPLRSWGVLQAIDGDHEVAPGISTRHLPGHTPGHQVVEVSDGGASLLLSGDAINHPAQLRQPELAAGPDEDAEGAMQVRRMLLAELVDSGRVLAPAHFAEPFGRLVSDGPAGGVSWVPVV
jgi:glyoxylase-like metal-dependent hydrolase (beta-lactamase superfamily II)